MFAYDRGLAAALEDAIAEMVRRGSTEEFYALLLSFGDSAPESVIDVLAEKIRGGSEVITPAFILYNYIESGNKYACDVIKHLLKGLSGEEFFWLVATMFAFYTLSPNRVFEQVMEEAMQSAAISHKSSEFVAAIVLGALTLLEMIRDMSAWEDTTPLHA